MWIFDFLDAVPLSVYFNTQILSWKRTGVSISLPSRSRKKLDQILHLFRALPEQRADPVLLHVSSIIDQTPLALDPGGEVGDSEEETEELTTERQEQQERHQNRRELEYEREARLG